MKSISRQQVLHSLLVYYIALCYVTPAMRDSLHIVDHLRQTPASSQVRVERVGIRLVRLPLKEAFETSFGRIQSRLIFLVSLDSDGHRG
jgi:hypothetical protein